MWLTERGLKPARLAGDRQTEIHFRRVAAVAEALGDEDWQFLGEVAKRGVKLGVDEERPRRS